MENALPLAKQHQTIVSEMMNGRFEIQVDVRDKYGDLIPFDAKHLPTDLKKDSDSIRRQIQYHLRSVAELYAEHGERLQREIEDWAEVAYHHSPEDLLIDDDWMNYYPGVVMSDRPYTTLLDATPNSEADQRYLTTLLLTGGITKKDREGILKRSQRLLCSLDPRDTLFFSETVLNECLEAVGLDTDARINKRLGRKPYTPVRKVERREILADIWEEKIAEGLLRHEFHSENWSDELEEVALKTFTWFAIETVLGTVIGYGQHDMNVGWWAVLQEASFEADINEYYLDPREEDTWVGLKELMKAVSSADTDQFHYSYQDGNCEGQRWFREVGLPTLYGQTADWWSELPSVKKGEFDSDDTIVILGNQRRSEYENLALFKNSYLESINEGGVRRYCTEKYTPHIEEVLRNA